MRFTYRGEVGSDIRFRNKVMLRNKVRVGFKVNPQAPVAQKVADEVAFRCFQGDGVEFFFIGPH